MKQAFFILLACMASLTATAESSFNLQSGTGSGNAAEYAWNGTVLTVNSGANITLTGIVSNGRRVEVAANATLVNITLNGVSITNVGDNNSPLLLNSGAVVMLKLEGNNTLTSGYSRAGLEAPAGTTLTIDGPGSLTAIGVKNGDYFNGAGIGGGYRSAGGTITIIGGTVTATSDSGGAGIGGGSACGSSGTITISGGIVTATCGYGGGAGIGTGMGYGDAQVCTITISGGIVTATSANSGAGLGGGAGIGLGADGSNTDVGSSITISGGTVTATSSGPNGAAGIGGGHHSAVGTITISGGTVTANGGIYGAGIGGGWNAVGSTVTISGGTVTANSASSGAAIGGGRNNLTTGTTTITGGSVKVNNTAGPQPVNGAGTKLYYNTLTLGSISAITPITASRISDAEYYGIKDVQTDGTGKVWFWLPAAAETQGVELTAGSMIYSASFARPASSTSATLNYYIFHENIICDKPNIDLSTVSAGQPLIITCAGNYTFTGTAPAGVRIVVAPNITGVHITLNGVSITDPDPYYSPLVLNSGAKVTLSLENKNTLTGNSGSTGIRAPSGTTLVIDGEGSLTANGAAIGGGPSGSSGQITINGGAIVATGGINGAGIGGDSGSITINGGNVTATAGGYGAGIGGGPSGPCGTIIITGGTVSANSFGGAGIGGSGGKITISGGTVTATNQNNYADIRADQITVTGGSVNASHGNMTGTPTNGTTTPVFLSTLTLYAVSEITPVTAGSIQGVVYGIKDVQTDEAGKVYFWLPAATVAQQVKLTANSKEYKNTFTRAAANSTTATLYLSEICGDSPSIALNEASTEHVFLITCPGRYTFTGAAPAGTRIEVAENTTGVHITLNGANISQLNSGSPLLLKRGAEVTVNLVNENSLTGNGNYAGIQAPEGATLTIDGSGSLTANGGSNSAGIGGGYLESGGAITLTGGTIRANSSQFGAGIGGGGHGQGSGGRITITGGTVTAGSQYGGAGIGGGYGGAGGTIILSGGVITATGGKAATNEYGGAGIGGGDSGDGGTIIISGGTITATGSAATDIGAGHGRSAADITISGGSVHPIGNRITGTPDNGKSTPVYLSTLTLYGLSEITPITAGSIHEVEYGIKDVQTDGAGKVYFWLPATATAQALSLTADQVYSNSFTRAADNTTAATLYPEPGSGGQSIATVTQSAGASMRAYPNPVRQGSALYLETTEADTGDSDLRIYDLTGACVKYEKRTGLLTELYLNLPAGVYFIRSGKSTVKVAVH